MLEKVEYNDVKCNGSLSLSTITEIKDLLTINDDGNLLYICHPRHIFENLEEDKETKIITSVDWDSINISLLAKYDDYGRFSVIDQYFRNSKNQFAYLNRRFSKMLKKYHENGNENFAYPLAIIEKVKENDDNSSYIPRGIVCAKQDGLMICNKMSNENINTWQKTLRFKNNYH